MGKEKVAVLGGSRGLGAALVARLMTDGYPLWVASRKNTLAIDNESDHERSLNWHSFDFSQKDQWPALVAELDSFSPNIIVYCAGGGPYGDFGSKSWKDHDWALKVTFECPAFLLWNWCRGEALKTVKKIVVVGSSIAEAQADPHAAMYCASKHALKGLISTLQKEYPQRKTALFSAPYMDTGLLPQGAWPRQTPGLVRPPAEVAAELQNFVFQ